jgi:lyso-ornithine lipid O-acyltransferase
MRRAGLALRLLLLGLLYVIVLGPLLLALRFGWRRIAGVIPLVFHRFFLVLFGVRVTERGTPPAGVATLVVANHVSWLDIPVIGSLHPLSFIAKSEIEGWPMVGFLARLQQSVFIDRKRKKATAEVSHAVAHRLAKGEAIVLFAEGTTGDGNRILPFRSSLVGAARATVADPAAGRIYLQPLAITYVRRNGLPISRRERPEVAWYGDMDLAPHLYRFTCSGPLDVVVVWGEPIAFNGDRKQATAAAESAVRTAICRLR